MVSDGYVPREYGGFAMDREFSAIGASKVWLCVLLSWWSRVTGVEINIVSLPNEEGVK